MVKDLIKVEGNTESFCDLQIISEVLVNGRVREYLSPNAQYLLFRKERRETKIIVRHRKKMNKLVMNNCNLLNTVEEVYGLKWVHGGTDSRARVFHPLFKKELLLWLNVLPERFVSTEYYDFEYVPVGCEEMGVKILKIRSSALVYTLQKGLTPENKNFTFDRLISVFRKCFEHSDPTQDFDKYISGWAERLVKEFF